MTGLRYGADITGAPPAEIKAPTLFRKLKARKAKYGFDGGQLSLANVIPMGDFLKQLYSRFEEDRYTIESGGWNDQSSVKLYTNDDQVAEFMQEYS